MRSICCPARISDRAPRPRGKSAAWPRRLRARRSIGLLHRQKPPCPSRCQRSAEAWWALRAPGRRGLEPASLRGWPPGKLPTLHSATTVVLHELAWASSNAPEDGFLPGTTDFLHGRLARANRFGVIQYSVLQEFPLREISGDAVLSPRAHLQSLSCSRDIIKP